jgi:hypothetical protein
LLFELLEPRMMLAGDGLLAQYFDEIDLTSPVAQTFVDPVVNFPNDALGADADGRVASDDNYSIRWTGWVLVDEPGPWQFKTLSNDGVRLWVNDTQLIDRWNQHVVATDTGNITLSAGWHPIRLEYFQQNGTAHIELRYSGPGRSEIVIPQNHLSSTDPAAGMRPTANAGLDQVIILPDDENSVTLNGSGSDVDGTIVAYEWSQLSGPSSATLWGADTPNLTASNLVVGAYIFHLKVTDNDGNTGSDEATVNVVEVTGDGVISGELKKWHKVTVTFDGPPTSETAAHNPFLDYRLNVTFTHTGTGKSYLVPGYYAADGNAANTHAESGNKWRVHFAPSEEGEWTYVASFRAGPDVAVDDNPLAGTSGGYFDNAAGTFEIGPTDKTGHDLRGKGLLEYVGGRYLQFAETGEYFLKQGADAPENLLAYTEFDGPFKTDGQRDQYIKDWSPHVQDWRPGNPTWAGDNGKGIIGAINYLAAEGQNVFSFLPMNIAGDDRNVFPYLSYNERLRMDVSRLDQWEILFEHADTLGMFLHFKTQETENELLLDGGDLGTERKLYYRELIARYSHHLALNWNLGEEINNATTEQKQAWAKYFWENDPYQHHIVIHNGANHFDLLGPYNEAAGTGSHVTGFSLQTSNAAFTDTFSSVTNYLTRSANAGKQWAVALDEPGDAQHALRPDNDAGTSHVDGRKNGLWPTFMAGGWGNEWYFGYDHAHSDLTLNDFRSRDNWWDYTRYALDFFTDSQIPFWEMNNSNSLISSSGDIAFAKPGEIYVVYLKNGGTTNINLTGQAGVFDIHWFDPRNGGGLQQGTVATVDGGGQVSIGMAPNTTGEDWVVLIRKRGVIQQAPSPESSRSIRDGARLEVEEFDRGGEGLAYHDIDTTNAGEAARTAEGVDVYLAADTGGGYVVGSIAGGEWLEYTVDVTSGLYDVALRVASDAVMPGQVRLLVGNSPNSDNFTEIGVFDVESTGGADVFETLTVDNVSITSTAGSPRVLRLEFVGGDFQLNWMQFHAAATLPGDYDHDGNVDNEDHAVWRAQFGSTSAFDADGNRDGVVDAADYVVWRARSAQLNPMAAHAMLAESMSGAEATQVVQATVDMSAADVPNEVVRRYRPPGRGLSPLPGPAVPRDGYLLLSELAFDVAGTVNRAVSAGIEEGPIGSSAQRSEHWRGAAVDDAFDVFDALWRFNRANSR